MCRSTKRGDKLNLRCPSKSDPMKRALASATQRLVRWERRSLEAEADGDTTRFERALGYLASAIEDITTRSQAPAPPPEPEIPEPLDSFVLTTLDDDALEALWQERSIDPVGQDLIEREWSRRDMRARHDVDPVEFVFTSYATLVERLHEPEALSDTQLKETWLDAHTDPRLRELAENEMDRRMLARAADPTQDPDLAGAIEERVGWSYEQLSPAHFRRYQTTLITDPGVRVQRPARTVGTPTERALKQEYNEFTFERYLAAEAHTRGRLLNARGRALKIDAFSLLSGNSKRAHAYGSEELLGFLGAHGGHMSFARFKSIRIHRVDYEASNIERFDDAAHTVSV